MFIEPGQTLTVRYGWTIVGLYTLIHPALLNQFQFPLPFFIMRIVSNVLNALELSLENAARVSPFLWNGNSDLPSIEVILNIDTDILTCLPDFQQVDTTMKIITSLVSYMYSKLCIFSCHHLSSLQLQFYTQSSTAGERGTLTEVDFALDGQFVSNWVDLSSINSTDNSIIGSDTMFLRRDVRYVTEILLLPHYTVFISAPVILILVYLYAFSYIQENYNRLESQSFSLFVSLVLYLSFLGVATIFTEFYFWSNSNSMHITAKKCFMFLFVVIAILISLRFVIFVIYFIVTGKTTGWTHGKKCDFLFAVAIILLIPPGLFAIMWLIVCSYSTLLFGLAYPFHTFSLVVLHMACAYITIVAGTIIFAGVWKKTKKHKTIIIYLFFICGIPVYRCLFPDVCARIRSY